MAADPNDPRAQRPETLVTTTGRHPDDHYGAVNPPVYHASTILFDSVETMRNPGAVPSHYGRRGTPGTFALEEAMITLEEAGEGASCRLLPSGLAALSCVLLTYSSAGGHVLIPDCAYEPTREFCNDMLSRFGVEITYYDPTLGAGIEALLRDNTQVILIEAPGSRTFEMTDVPAITALARARGITTAADNTWASPLCFKPLKYGVDLSIHSATKFIVGHSDALLGMVTAVKSHAHRLTIGHRRLGQTAAPDDVYLALRGLRTLSVRMRQHQESGLTIARWLQNRPEVSRLLYPALPDDPGHALWKRDFTGAPGVFGVVFNHGTPRQQDAFINALSLFGIGYSFGGFESLIVPTQIGKARTATDWSPEGPVFRLHVGLEHPDDLIRDLTHGFEQFHAAR